MKFVEPRPFADPDAAARKLAELANAVEPVQDGRIHIEKINGPFLYQLKGTPAEAGHIHAPCPPWPGRGLIWGDARRGRVSSEIRKNHRQSISWPLFKAFDFCLPTKATTVPSGAEVASRGQV